MNDAQFSTDEGGQLILSGTGARPRRVELIGPRAGASARITGGGKTWRAVLPLRAARWGGPELPLPTGRYRVQIESAPDAQALTPVSLPVTQLGELRASLDGLQVEIGPPINPAYDSGEAQAALERRYATRPGALENAVFFESFFGFNASCNPLAIDRELARQAPGVIRYWSVVDLSVRVPEGAVAVVEGTEQWWRARGSARLLVINDWLRRRFSRRPGQIVLQTWHGTPLKRLALHRPGFDPRRILAVLRESRRWNVLLAQNSYSARTMRKAYGFVTRPIWVEGYPRNDVLRSGDAAAVRAALGIAADQRVVLYAPTWRDDRQEIVDFIDPEAVAEAIDAVVLVRGHSRTLRPGSNVTGARVIDVTAYPDAASLLLVANALITDYSSVMFDFSVTGKPIFFLAPDLDHFRQNLRGFYFDFAEQAPGPMLHTQDALIQAIRAHDPGAYSEQYARWQRTFNSRDDGRAAERVVARILDQGFVTRSATAGANIDR